jgi:hypothetical protein
MKITRRELKSIIKKELLKEEKFEFDIGLSPEEGSPRIFYREESGKVDAYVEDADGEVIQKLANASGKKRLNVSDPKENERDILGALHIALEGAKEIEAKSKITRAISRLLGDDETLVQKNMSNYLNNRHLSSAAQSVKEKFKFVQ